jgi:hypothetical protein
MTIRKKRIVLGVGLAALGLLAVSSILNRRAIQLEWWRWQAARDGRSTAWMKLYESGDEGFPYIARLIKDGGAEKLGWFIATQELDWNPLLQYLRSRDTHALVRLSFTGSFPRSPTWNDLAVHEDWYSDWSGSASDHLEPSSQAIDFLEDFFLLPDATAQPRAIDALSAMLRPGEVRGPQGPLAKRIVAVLARIAREDTDPEIRLYAINRMMMRDEEGIDHLPTLDGWWSILDRPRASNEGNELDFDPDSIRALAYLDRPAALRIFFNLQKAAGIALKLTEVLSSKAPLGPIPMPNWLPFEESVKRFLQRPGERMFAAEIAAEENLRDLRPAIGEAMEQETDKDFRMIFRGCLLVLGDEGARPLVRSALLALAEGSQGMSPYHLAHLLLLSGDRPTLELAFERGKLNIHLEDYVEGIPPELREPHQYGIGTSSGDEEEKPAGLSPWWQMNKARIAWDPTKRRFVLTPP